MIDGDRTTLAIREELSDRRRQSPKVVADGVHQRRRRTCVNRAASSLDFR